MEKRCLTIHTGIYASAYTPDRTQILSKPFTKDDTPNFAGSFYSRTKAHTEDILRTTYPHVLTLRIRMPISDDLHPRSFVTKITSTLAWSMCRIQTPSCMICCRWLWR